MKNFTVTKSCLQGMMTIPPSKSHTLRAILFASLANGISKISSYLYSPDAFAMMRACESLGARIEKNESELKIEGVNGKISSHASTIDAGNSGIVLRFLAGVVALGEQPWTITGDHSIRTQRPMQPLLEALHQLGVHTTSQEGYAPLIIQGPIKKYFTLISGEDSQPVSALLIAGIFLKTPLHIRVNNPGEKPWVALTLNWLDRLGVSYTNTQFCEYEVRGKGTYESFEYSIPGDWSSAAFPIIAALITESEVLVKNVDFNECQGDKKILEILESMGAVFIKDESQHTLLVKKGSLLKGRVIDINECIDAIAILAVLGCYAEGETHLINAAVAQTKECNRPACLTQELKKMGADIQQTEDGLKIRHSALKGASLHSYQDHRMAMSLAIAGLGAEGVTEIQDVECVSKSFPDFLEKFQKLGAHITADVVK